ncbi:MAG: hypothetical protein Q8L48_25270 [Archangium sp.]|nr:hypothetical protein [Archangium sp.]
MSTKVAPPKNTGGGGFVFEEDVCAWLLACMLAGEPPFEPELGVPIRVDFQTRPDGWLLDDALVTTIKGAEKHRFALSIKSNPQFTSTTAPTDFVTCAWEQWLHMSSSVFDRDQDFMALVTTPLSGAAEAAVSGLVAKARAGDPAALSTRIALPGWASEDERGLFASFRCPAAVGVSPSPTDADTVRLLQRIRHLRHDFGETISESLKRALALCRTCVRSGSSSDAETLWHLLRGVAAELRPLAGSVTQRQLVERLRHRVRLADYPDHAADWASLDARTTREAAQVIDAIAGRVRLPREASVGALETALGTQDLVALLGASGSGKSAVTRALLERRFADGNRTLWTDARSLDCADFGTFELALRLQHPLAELLASEPSAAPVLILDGLDRLYSHNAFRNATALQKLARMDAPATRWRIVVPCQSAEWPRVLEALQRAGMAGETWKQLPLEALTVAQLKPVSDAIPALGRLLLQPKVGPLLTNLKLLDLVARRVDAGTDVDASGWVGESSVAEWFWSAEIARGADGIARGRFARELAQRQADELVPSVATDDFEVSDLAPLASLAADQLCVQVPGDRIAFSHDLYGDWARLRVLLNHRADLPAFFRQRQDSPLWHRALRLFGIYLLEHEGGVDDWRKALASFGSLEAGVLIDVLLEAPIFAVNSRVLLNGVVADLVAGEGRLLRRLLTRFLAFATVPNPQMTAVAKAVGLDAHFARATYRLPYWPLWLGVLPFLHEHRATLLAVAPCEIARVVEMWLSFIPKGSLLRGEAAELAVLLGQHALSTRETYGGEEWQSERRRFYACALAAAHERTDDVVAIALSAAERPPVSAAPSSTPRTRRRVRSLGGTGVMRGPWPDGPLARVDEAFQDVVLETGAVLDLYRERPATAREVVLASLIQGPVEEDWNDGWMHRRELSIVDRNKWLPAFYTQGPFLACLRENFAEGLELVARLVEFAAARERENWQREASAWRARAIAEGQLEEEVDRRMAEPPRLVVLLDDGGTRAFFGDESTYCWSAGLGSPPDAVEAALMALEQYLYLRLDDGKDIAEEVTAIFARCESVALLGVLCDVGKRQRALFEGPLKPLLSAAEPYVWEITKRVQGHRPLMMGPFNNSEFFINLARRFHGLEHRNFDLRHIAQSLLFEQPAMRAYFDGAREAWSAQPALSERISESQQQLAVMLNFKNYERRNDPKLGQVLVNVEALRQQEALVDERQAADDQMVIMTFPMRCRTILDEGKVLTGEQLAGLWAQWERIRELAQGGPALPSGEERFGTEYADAIAGGVAVFLWHADWCALDAARRPLLTEAVREFLAKPPERREFDNDHSVSTWTSDCFATDAVALLWLEDPADQEWRRAIAGAAFSQRYVATRLLFDRCAGARRTLAEDFSRLRRLALEWAFLRVRVDLLRRVPREALSLDQDSLERLQRNLTHWEVEKIEAFVSASSLGMPRAWTDCDDPDRFREVDALRRRPDPPPLDLRVIRCAHEWLPLPDQAQDEREREEVIHFWRSALRLVVARPAADLRRRESQYPHEEERWVLERVGALVLQLRASEQAELLWQPVIDLHSEGNDWPEAFAYSLHRHALTAQQTPSTYPSLVRSMVQSAFVDVEGKRRWASHEGVWDALLGVDGWSTAMWEPRHLATVSAMQDVFRLWMEKVPIHGRRLAGFATWLARPVGLPLRFAAMTWLLGLVRVEKRREPRDVDEAEDPVANLLNVVWAEQEATLRADVEAFQAFRALLGWLGDRQNQLGLELLGRLGSLT